MSDAMNDTTMAVGGRHISRAVYQNKLFSRQGLSERVFARFFSGLVYAQIWEDPQIDMEAMALGESHRIVTIASGGCNILAYLTRKPAHIDAVDLNRAHIALNRLKLTAIAHLPGHGDVLRFFGKADQRFNSQAYDRFIAPHLDRASRRYWEQRNWRGRRRVADFNRNFYKTGLLGWFITARTSCCKAARSRSVRPDAGAQSSRAASLFRGETCPSVRSTGDPLGHPQQGIAFRTWHTPCTI